MIKIFIVSFSTTTTIATITIAAITIATITIAIITIATITIGTTIAIITIAITTIGTTTIGTTTIATTSTTEFVAYLDISNKFKVNEFYRTFEIENFVLDLEICIINYVVLSLII